VLLKYARSVPSAKNWANHVTEQFRVGKNQTDPQVITHMRTMASQYVKMLSSIDELKYLRSLDSGEKLDPRDKIRATAGRVGLSVPKFADDGDNFDDIDQDFTSR